MTTDDHFYTNGNQVQTEELLTNGDKFDMNKEFNQTLKANFAMKNQCMTPII